jgi:hypothetical protein
MPAACIKRILLKRFQSIWLRLPLRVWIEKSPLRRRSFRFHASPGSVLCPNPRYATDAAEKLARDMLATQRRVLGPEHPDTASTTYDLGRILAHNGHNDEAFALLREAIGHGLDATTVRAIATTPDLKQLHKDARFRALAAYALQRAATGKFN